MKQTTILTIVLGILLLAVTVLILRSTVFKPVNAGLQVKSTPASAVFLDGKNLGRTPYDDTKLKSGEATLRLVPENEGSASPWETKVKLVGGTQTIINWEFGTNENLSAGEIMTLEKITDKKNASLTIISSPDSGLVKVNGEPKGFTPLSFEKLEAGDKQITISASGFEERNINVKLLAGYRLILNAKLSEQEEGDGEASPSGELTPTPSVSTTPTPSTKSSPTPSPTGKTTPTPVALDKPYVTIKSTPTGFLRVRSEASTGSSELGRVSPGESFSLVDEQTGWYKITYESGKEGWISSQYATKFE